MTEPSQLDQAVRDYVAVRRRLVASTQDWRQLELSMAQLRCLVELYRRTELTVRGLADALGRGLPAASLLADRVVQAGLVERRTDPDDRRRVLLRLTAEGEEIAFRLSEGRAALLREWMASLDDADFQALARGLQALAAAAALEASLA